MWSNAVGFTVPVGAGNTLVPALLNMVVGDTRTLQALGANGQTVTGLTWATTDPTIVSLSPDDPPLLTALAAGHVTITAGSGSTDVTVFPGPLPLGTVIWSNPGNGSGVNWIVPAVPSTTGVADVFAFQADGTVQAIAADGTTAWTADISQAQAFAGGTYDMSQGTLLPDFQGGLVVMNNDGSIYKLDGITGQAYPAYTLPGPGCSVYCELPTGGLAVHPDGTIFTTYTDENGYNVIGIDPTTGTQKFMVPATFNGVEPFQGGSTTIIVAGDGYAYYSYPYLDSVYEYPATCRLGVLRVSSSGDAQSIPVFSATCGGWAGGIGYTYLTGANMITNADQGILLTWQTPNPDGSGYTSRMATVTGGAAAMAMEPAVPSEAGSAVVPVLQAQDGSFVGTFWDSSGDYDDMVAFDATGNVRWIVPNETPQIATADGGVIGQSGITYDQNGNATGQVPSLAGASPSWGAQVYTAGASGVNLNNYWVEYDSSFGVMPGGNPSGNGTAVLNVGLAESFPLWSFKSVVNNLFGSPTCKIGADKVQLQPVGQQVLTLSADQQATVDHYQTTKQNLLTYLVTLTAPGAGTCSGTPAPTAKCGCLFNAIPGGPQYFSQLAAAVTRQIPYDGILSNLSKAAAGEWSQGQRNNPKIWGYLQQQPICQEFWKGGYWSGVGATAQIQPLGLATDVYLATMKQPRQSLTQSTILHESLHNLTGLSDDGLYNLLTGTSKGLNGQDSVVISTTLLNNGCAAN